MILYDDILGLKSGYVCAMEKGWKLHTQPIAHDEELQERMRDTAQAFWENIEEKDVA